MNIDHTRLTPARFGLILAQLALVFIAAYRLRIEQGQNLPLILPLIFFGFAIHAWLPLKFRAPFFLALSILSIGVVLGISNGLWLLGIGAVLFSICHLPGGLRTGLLLAAGALLAVIKLDWIPFFANMQIGAQVLPILAAMFMFRLFIYVYDMRHVQQEVPITQRLAYFFMLPNVCFPLFPVVDYRGFVREYYSAPAHEIHQKGLRWILRGIVHLLLYRLIYYYFTPTFEEVNDLAGVVQYIVSSYLLYLRISGLFHIAVGILCLFGYNMPQTNRLYFLASSFTDFWRRINIYFKDFVMKLFYYPLFMLLRKGGMTQAVVIASLVTLLMSWILHSYQVFWLQGAFPLTIQDTVFWPILGVAVAINAMIELKYGRTRTSETQRVWAALLLSVKTMAMFCFISVLWSFWTAGTIDEWFAVVNVARAASALEVFALIGGIAGVILLGTAIQLIAKWDWVLSNEIQPSFVQSVSVTGSVAILAIIIGMPQVGNLFDSKSEDVWASLTNPNRLNLRDRELQTRGYYEGLLGAEAANQSGWTTDGTSLLKRYFSMVGYAGLAQAVRGTGDFRRYELIPSLELSYKGEEFNTNRWGMRDQEYEQVKAPGVCRVLLFGASFTMGSGIPDGTTYESLLESRLNRERPMERCRHHEILNFGVAGYTALQSAILAQQQVPAFDPDVVIYATAQPDLRWVVRRLAEAVMEGAPLEGSFFQEIADTTGITSDMNQYELIQRLTPVAKQLVEWSYNSIVEVSEKNGARAVWMFIPRADPSPGEEVARYDRLAPLAKEAGMTTLSLAEAYKDHDPKNLQISSWDKHPNKKASGLLAQHLYEVLARDWNMLLPPPEVALRPGDDSVSVDMPGRHTDQHL